MATIIASNHEVSAELDDIKTRIGAGAIHVKLFTNSALSITSDTLLSGFTEATYSGYSQQAVPSFAANFKVATGKYESDSGSATFPAPSSGSQSVYGYYLTDGTDWFVAVSFGVAVLMQAGGPSLLVSLNLQNIATYQCTCP